MAPCGFRSWTWQDVSWSTDPVPVCGWVDGLPVLSWGWADRHVLATRRQLRERGLRPGGQDPVAVLVFGHRLPNRRRVELADLFRVDRAVAKRAATPAQLRAVEKALRARRTCRCCGQEQDHYVSRESRLCPPCEDATGFWAERAAEHGWGWAA